MEYRQLGSSGPRVPAPSFGTSGGKGRLSGARDEERSRWKLGAVGWSLIAGRIAALDAAGDVPPPYPHTPYRQREGFARLNPALV